MKHFLLTPKAIFTTILSLGILSSFAQSTTFNYSGATQSYTVPPGVTKLHISSFGARGGNTSSHGPAFGGAGAEMSGDFSVTPGQVLDIIVGGQGEDVLHAAGGGGGSFVWDDLSSTLLIAAGGGGGAGCSDNTGLGIDGLDATTANNGINGLLMPNGAGTGGNGATAPTGGVSDYAGGGAGWLSNGADGTNLGFCDHPFAGGGITPLSGGNGGQYGGTGGSDGNGGFGGGGGGHGRCGAIGGGGGGGYSGGGAGGEMDTLVDTYNPGGGGGSYNSGTNQSNTVGNTGDGIVVICELPITGSIAGANPCVTATSNMIDIGGVAGGTWTSSNPSIATIGSSTGVVTGVAVGTATITYMPPANICGTSFTTTTITVNPLPVVSGGANVTICKGSSATLTGSGTLAYFWSPASGLSCTNCTSPVASPTTTTTYTVTGTNAVIIYNQSFTYGVIPTTQCSAWETYRASLTGAHTYTGFTIRGSQNTTGISCTDPVVATAVANALNTGTVYYGSSDGHSWHVGTGCAAGETPGCGAPVAVELSDGSDCSCGALYSIRPAINNFNWGGIDGATCSAPSQTMEVDFFIADGCSNTATVTVSVNPLPTIHNVTGGGSYCAGGAGVHAGVDFGNDGFRYQLYNGLSTTGSPVNGADTSVDFGLQTAAGYYTVVATDTTTGCEAIMNGTDTVTIIPVVVPSVSISISTPDTICAGTTTIFTATPVNEGETPIYHWWVNDTAVGTDSTAYWYAPGDGNRVSVTMISSHVCAIPDTVTDTFTMAVLPNGYSAVHIVATPSDTVCEGTPVTLIANPTFGGHGPSFVWIKNTAIVSGSSSYSYTPVDSDNIYCIMVSNYMCLLDTVPAAFSDALYMNVEAPVVPAVTITGRPSIYIGKGQPDTLVATVALGGSTPLYQWYLNNVPQPGATNSTWYRGSFNDHDSVSCMVTRTDACGLSTINSVVMRVGVGVPSIVVNGGLSIVPNPNKGMFTLKGSLGTTADEDITLTISDMLGQTVYNNKVSAKNGNIDEPVQLDGTLPNGMYILSVHSENVNNVFRFVIER